MIKSKSQPKQAPLVLLKQELPTPFQHQSTYLKQHSERGGQTTLFKKTKQTKTKNKN